MDLLIQVQVTGTYRHEYLFNLCTKNSAIVYDKYNTLISDTKVTEYSHSIFWVSFKLL